jgi:hypothetical protein
VTAAAFMVAVCEASASAKLAPSFTVTFWSAGVSSAHVPGVTQFAGMFGTANKAVLTQNPKDITLIKFMLCFISATYLLSPIITIGIDTV